MQFFRFFPVAVIAAAMGIVACGDSGSNADIESCKVTSQDPFTIETVQQGITIVTTFELKNGKVIQTMDAGIDIPEQSCEEYRKDNDYGEVSCSGHKLIATSREDFTESRFNSLKQSYTAECNALN